MYILVKIANCVEAARSFVGVGREVTEECELNKELAGFKTLTFNQSG